MAYSETERKKWRDDYLLGSSIESVAIKFGVSDEAVSLHLNKLGIVRRRPNYNHVKNELYFFDNLIERPSGCIEWVGKLGRKGYGFFSINGKTISPHRYSYSIHHGDFNGLLVCHTCDNRVCVNPDHLFLGTNKDNMMDCARKLRTSDRKLSPSNVIEIRKLIKTGISSGKIAKDFGVSRHNINSIKRGNTWNWLEDKAPVFLKK